MTISAKAIYDSNAIKIIRTTTLVVAAGLAAGGLSFLMYQGWNLNRANIRTEATLRYVANVEVLKRTPREGPLRYIPWNDDNGYAIVNLYGASGKKLKAGIDDNLDGKVESVDIPLGGQEVDRCYPNMAVTAAGSKISPSDEAKGIEGALKEAALAYCKTEIDAMNAIYKEVLRTQ